MLRMTSRRFCAAAAPFAAASVTATNGVNSPASRVFKDAALPAAYLSANSEAVKNIYHNNFTISERCWDRVHSKNRLESVPNKDRFLRLAVESGGCHGYMYKFQFDDVLDQEEDVMFFEDELRDTNTTASGGSSSSDELTQPSTTGPAVVVVDKSTAECMSKAVLDYHMELKGSAFVVVGNEKVDHLCACAMSFSVRK
jgi:iron-sulfur cluster assembly 2